jgi:uncharacterized protein
MRLVTVLAAAAALPSAAFPQPVVTQPLARGEVLLEVNAVGSARTSAVLATVSAHVISSGNTEAEAQSASEAALRRVAAAARSIGVAEDDIEITSMAVPVVRTSMVAPPGTAPPPQPPPVAVGGRIEIRLRAPDRTAALQRALEQAGAEVSPPAFMPADDAAARRAARAEALATARADAEAYAAELGMRVLRIVRVTERTGMDWLSLMMGNEPPWMGRRNRTGAVAEAETRVIVGVDFALAPR